MSSEPNSIPAREPQVESSREIAEARRSAVVTWLAIAVAVGLFAWRFPSSALTVVNFIVVLSVLVFVHEWGHYQFARWAGMKVNRFAIGFPPWIYTRYRNGIAYSIGALPIGGMVDIAGLGSEEEMVATAKDVGGGVGTAGTTVSGVAVEDASRPSRMDAYRLRHPDRPHGEKEFQDATLGWRFWALFAGPLMNFLFAVVVFIGLFSIAGVPVRSTNQVEGVNPDTPAQAAGIQAGDRIIGVNDKRLSDPTKVRQLIREGRGQQLTLVIERAGHVLRIPVRPKYTEEPTPEGKMERVPMIGVRFRQEYERLGFVESVRIGSAYAIGLSTHILSFLGRAVTGRLSEFDKRGVGGPVRIAQEVGETARSGWRDLILFSAMLSVNLGLMNLLPFPALDGGRILFLGYELVMRRPFDPRKEGLVHMVGMLVLLAFMLFITVRDVLPWIEKGLQKIF
ncbi:MAG: RIP metalloprotease [Armatimonadota bacterium]|nr:RIP metalloprotease [Armatimonadota bacterium]